MVVSNIIINFVYFIICIFVESFALLLSELFVESFKRSFLHIYSLIVGVQANLEINGF